MPRVLPASLRGRLLALILFAVLTPILLMVYSAVEQRRAAIHQAEASALRLARFASAHEEQVISGVRQLVSSLVKHPDVRAGNAVACQALLQGLVTQDVAWDYLAIADARGVVTTSTTPLQHPVSVADEPWFGRLLASRRYTVSDYQVSRISGRPVLVCAAPVLDESGRVRGVVLAGLSLAWVGRVMREIDLPGGAVIVIVDRSGVVMARVPADDGRDGRRLAQAPLVRAMRTSVEGSVESVGADGVRRLYAFTPLRQASAQQGFVCAGLAIDSLLAEPRRMFAEFLLLLALVGLLVLLFAWRGTHALVLAPVEALVRAARGVRAGNLSARSGLAAGPDEIGQLAHAFDEMATALERRRGERREAELAIRHSEERFRALIDQSSDVVALVDETSRVLYASASVERVLGYPIEEFVGIEGLVLVHPEDQGRAREVLGRLVLAPGRVEYVTVRVRHHDGSWRWVDSALTNLFELPSVGAVVVNFRDVTEGRLAEQAVRESEARKTAMVESALDAIVTVDQQGVVLEFNPAAERMFGYQREQALGQPMAELIVPPDLREALRAGLSRSREGGMHQVLGRRVETRAIRSDGSELPVEFAIASIHAAGGPPFFTAYIRDITDRRRYEQTLEQLSMLDDLTGLCNRRGFLAFADQQVHLAERSGRPVWLLFADLDGLKWINDSFGHAAGDSALAEIGAILRKTFRESDVIARLGGDEFVVLGAESADADPDHMTRRLLRRIEARNRTTDKPFSISLSLGWAHHDLSAPCRVEDLLARGDEMMYWSKRGRRAA